MDIFENISVRETLIKLAKATMDYIKVKCAYDYAHSKENIKNSMNDLKSRCETTAKNYGISLEDASQRYAEAKAKVSDIEQNYQGSLNTLSKNHLANSLAINMLISEQEGKKAELLESIAIAKEAKDDYIKTNKPELAKTLSDTKKQLSAMRREATKAFRDGDYEKVTEYIDKCKAIENEWHQKEQENNGGLQKYDSTIEQLKSDYSECNKSIKSLEDISTQIKEQYEKDSKEYKNWERLELAKVENKGIGARLKAFFAKTALKNINNVKHFTEEFLTPMQNKVNAYATSIPQRISDTKQLIGNTLKEIAEKSKNGLEDIGHNVIETFNNTREAVLQGATTIKDTITQSAVATRGAVLQGATIVKDNVTKNAVATRDAVLHGATIVKDTVTKNAVAARDTVLHGVTTVGDALAHGTATVGHGIATGVNAIGKGVQNTAFNISDGIKRSYQNGKQSAHNAIYGFKNAIATSMENVASKLNQRAEEIRSSHSQAKISDLTVEKE